MKLFVNLLTYLFISFSLFAQEADIRTDANVPYELDCGDDINLLVKLTEIVYPADSRDEAEDQRKEIRESFRVYFKNFPEATKSFYTCINEDCQDESCYKDVENIFVNATEPKNLGNGNYRIIMYVYVNAECKQCGHPKNGDPDDPESEECPIEILAECMTTSTASYKHRVKKMKVETEEEALEEIERLKEIMEKMIDLAPDVPNVTLECVPHGCEPQEVCNGSYTIDDVTNTSPTFDGECWTVEFYLTITATCSSCTLPEKDPVPRSNRTLALQVELKPNPVHDVMMIELDTEMDMRSWQLEIFNAQGQLMFASTNALTDVQAMDVSDWSNGLYYLLIQSESEIIAKKSFIVNH